MTPHPRILVVDDEEANRELLVRRLQRDGYDVVTAAGGQQALDVLDGETIDLVLLDVMMPVMSGVDVLRRLRATAATARLPVIMVTARTESDDVVEALDLGANDYVTKPVDPAVLLARVRSQLSRRRAEADLAQSEDRYVLAAQVSNDGLWDWNVVTGEVFYSARWGALLGLEHAALVADTDTWFSLVHPDDLPRVRAEIDEHLTGGTDHVECEHRLRHADGRYVWMLARGVARRDARGAAVRVAGSLTDISQGKAADALTGLPNRVLFLDRLNRLIRYAQRDANLRFAVLYVDLDRFKQVNDTLGHHAGDELLLQLGRRLERCLRAGDTVARFEAAAAVSGNVVARIGGDEFAVILSGLKAPSDAEVVAARILQVLEEPFTVAGQQIFAAASIGIARGSADYRDAAEMCRDADLALYKAKDEGRGRCCVFDESLRQAAEERFQIESDLRVAVEQGQLAVHYQPIVSITSGHISGLEALLRWAHPTRGLLAAERFVPVADETGLIVPIGYAAFDLICAQVAQWRAHGRPTPTVAVNLSARQVAEPDLAARFAAITARHGATPSAFEFEIAETAIMADLDTASATVFALHEAGFRLTLDGFGSGYASLTDLRRLPVDRFKLDRQLLAVAGSNTSREQLVPSVLALAREMQVAVVAEGIETQEQLQRLHALDCDVAQGFYFLEAVGPEAIGAVLAGAALEAEGR